MRREMPIKPYKGIPTPRLDTPWNKDLNEDGKIDHKNLDLYLEKHKNPYLRD